jgi:hypothetical protein
VVGETVEAILGLLVVEVGWEEDVVVGEGVVLGNVVADSAAFTEDAV